MQYSVVAFVTLFLVLLSNQAYNGNAKMINGYYENWVDPVNPGSGGSESPSYYKNDIASANHVLYSFLTFDTYPNPDYPAEKYWNGKAIYESMTAADVIEVMTETHPHWENEYEWQRAVIAALIKATHKNNAKFIWGIGGWSDVTKTLHEEQIPDFVDKCVELLKLDNGTLGDGIDFDWEHLSEDPQIKDEQRARIAKTMLALRTRLDEEGMQDKRIGYTTRFNAFWDEEHGNKPENYTWFASDGEGIKVEETLNELGSSLNAIVDWVHIMQYDVPPSDLNCPDKMELSTFVGVLEAFAKYVDKSKIVMGFEPGIQYAGGLWEGSDVDKQVIDHIEEMGYGGVMFWALNEHESGKDGCTGQNAQDLAKYAKNHFS